MPDLLVSAAEPSGDVLASELVLALRRRLPSAAFRGIAGPAMRAAGVEPVARVEDIGVMGLAEVARKAGAIRRARVALSEVVDSGPRALVVVDSPDLHLPVARRARSRGVPAIGYVSPQVWAWRKGRVASISRSLDRLLCLFAFEPDLYRGTGLDVRWVGHPVVDRMPPRASVDPHTWGLLPGSRAQELDRMAGPFLAAAERVRTADREARFVLVVPDDLVPRLPALPEWVTRAPSVAALSGVRGALTKSGTVTLELAVMGVPQVVAHRVHPLTFRAGRLLVSGVNHIALPNVLAGRAVVPEFVQEFEPEDLAAALVALPERQDVPLEALGAPGAAGRAADAVLEALA